MSVEAKGSTTTTCASETDDADYETSSEGRVRVVQEKQTIEKSNIDNILTNSKPMCSECNNEAKSPISKEEKSIEESSYDYKDICSSSVLIRSESMPLLKNSLLKEANDDEGHVALTSESSLARERKMKIIVARMDPLLSSGFNLTMVTSADTLKVDLTDNNCEAKKLESRIELPVLQNTMDELSSSSKEVTYCETLDVERSTRERSHLLDRTSHSSFRSETGNSQYSQEDDDLIGIAENPHPSIKSFYFPPNPQEKKSSSTHSKIQHRVMKDLEALLRIDGELSPLQHKLNEITGKFRALNLTIPPLLSQEHYSSWSTPSPNMSSYYLHRTETFGHDSNINNVIHFVGKQTPNFTMTGNFSREIRATDHLDNRPFCPLGTESVPLNRNSVSVKKTFSKCANIGTENLYPSRCPSKAVSNVTSNWLLEENDSCVTVKNSYVQFEGRINKDPSGSLIPSVSSSCYKNRIDYQRPYTHYYSNELETGGYNSSSTKQSVMTSSPSRQPLSNRSIDTMSASSRPTNRTNFVNIRYQDVKSRKPEYSSRVMLSDESGCTSRYAEKEFGKKSVSNNLAESLYAPSTSTAPEVRVISMNTKLCATVEKHYTGPIVGGANSSFREVTSPCQDFTKNQKLLKNDDSSYHTPEENVLPLMIIGSSGSNKTRYVNYTRVNSQTSLIISKKDQSIETSDLGRTQNAVTHSSAHLIAKKNSGREIKKIRDMDVQCSGFNLTYRQKEIVLRRSMESLLRPSESEDSNTSNSNFDKSRSIQIPNASEKVVVVPIRFIDGVPEPPKVPLFKFSKSKCYLPKTNHRMVKLEERASTLTQSSLLSDTSVESLAMGTYLRNKLINREHWNSGLSVSCVSRNASSIHSKHPSQLSSTMKTLSEQYQRTGKSRKHGSVVSGSTHASRSCAESTKQRVKKVIRGMSSSPEDFLCDT